MYKTLNQYESFQNEPLVEDCTLPPRSMDPLPFHSTTEELTEKQEWKHMSTPSQYLSLLLSFFCRFTFLTHFAILFTERGYCFLPGTSPPSPLSLSERDMLLFLHDFSCLEKRVKTSYLSSSLDWKEQTLFAFYYHVYQQQDQCDWTTITQAASYVMQHREFFSPTEWSNFCTTLLNVMEQQKDWELFDLFQRHELWLLPEQRSRVWQFYENFRFERLDTKTGDDSHRQNETPSFYSSSIDFNNLNHMNNLQHEQFGETKEEEVNDPVTTILQDKMKDIFQDRQNIHNRGIQDSVRTSLLAFWEEFPFSQKDEERVTHQQIFQLFKDLFFSKYSHDLNDLNDLNDSTFQKEMFEQTLFRMFTDPSTIDIGGQRISLRDVVDSLYRYVLSLHDSPDIQYEVLKRWMEEWQESAGTCFSGHLTRLVNILIGFHPAISLQIDTVDQMKIIWRLLLQHHISIDPHKDDILESMMEPIKYGRFHRWIFQHRKIIHQYWEDKQKEYQWNTKDMREGRAKAWDDLFPTLSNMFPAQTWWHRTSQWCRDKIFSFFFFQK